MSKDGFLKYSVGKGIRLFVYPTRKFKTCKIQLFFHRNLSDNDETAKLALYSMMLEHGTRSLPGIAPMAKFLEEMYGASCGTDVIRRGDTHALSLQLNLLGERYLPRKEKLMEEAMLFIRDLLSDPPLENGVYPGNRLDQEKTNLINIIKGIEDDRREYAVLRCLQNCCKGELFALPRYGRERDVRKVSDSELVEFGRRLISESPLDIYVVGDVSPEKTKNLCKKAFDWKRSRISVLNKSVLRSARKKVQRTTEKKKIEQGVLVMAFRTDAALSREHFYPGLFMNGVLGGFSHSKLFQNVREKEGLAYYSYSSVEVMKGLLLVVCGISGANRKRTAKIVLEQMEAIAGGNLSEFEMESTRKGLISRITNTQDSLGGIVDLHFERDLLGRNEDIKSIADQYAKIGPAQISNVARLFKLDTEFFLSPI